MHEDVEPPPSSNQQANEQTKSSVESPWPTNEVFHVRYETPLPQLILVHQINPKHIQVN